MNSFEWCVITLSSISIDKKWFIQASLENIKSSWINVKYISRYEFIMDDFFQFFKKIKIGLTNLNPIFIFSLEIY